MNAVQRNGSDSEGDRLTRNVILTAAREVLQVDGYEGFSLRKLAKAVGCAPGTIYLYFTSKSELFETLAAESLQRLHRSVSGLRDRHRNDDPVPLLKKTLYTLVEFGLRNPGEYEHAFLHRAADDIARIDSPAEVLRSVVARCVYEGAFRPNVDVDCTTDGLFAAAHGITLLLIHR